MRYKLYCDANYYSSACSVYCVAQDSDTRGHYTCDPVTGSRICRPGMLFTARCRCWFVINEVLFKRYRIAYCAAFYARAELFVLCCNDVHNYCITLMTFVSPTIWWQYLWRLDSTKYSAYLQHATLNSAKCRYLRPTGPSAEIFCTASLHRNLFSQPYFYFSLQSPILDYSFDNSNPNPITFQNVTNSCVVQWRRYTRSCQVQWRGWRAYDLTVASRFVFILVGFAGLSTPGASPIV